VRPTASSARPKQVARSSARNVGIPNRYAEQQPPDQEPQVPEQDMPPQRRPVDRTGGTDQPALNTRAPTATSRPPWTVSTVLAGDRTALVLAVGFGTRPALTG
jgi:hypothetical protein